MKQMGTESMNEPTPPIPGGPKSCLRRENRGKSITHRFRPERKLTARDKNDGQLLLEMI